mgnify:CR=1 FL=1
MPEILTYDPTLCINCRACESVCIAENNRSPLSVQRGMFCLQCNDPYCLKSCTKQAIVRDSNGYIHVIENRCTGCQSCVLACPFGAITLDTTNTAILCNHCKGKYLCATVCPTKAITLKTKF